MKSGSGHLNTPMVKGSLTRPLLLYPFYAHRSALEGLVHAFIMCSKLQNDSCSS